LRPSFIPPRPTRELRDLTRQRTRLTRESTAVSNRVSKVLEDANIKLGSVSSEVLGISGRAMIESLIRGRSDPEELADLARRRLRAKIPLLRLTLQGSVTEHHRFMLRALMDQLAEVEAMIGRFDARIVEALAPFEEAMARLATIPGVDRRVAQVVLSEIGTDMGRFPTSGHLSSWAGVASRNDESAGMRRTGRTPPGNVWLKSILVQAA
jgi:transposase